MNSLATPGVERLVRSYGWIKGFHYRPEADLVGFPYAGWGSCLF